MKLGVISDTHDNIPNIKKAVEIFNQREVKFVLHAGDYVAPFSLKPLAELKVEWLGVFGNNDGEKKGLTKVSGGRIRNQPLELSMGERKIVVVHEIDNYIGQSAELVIFGHTHKFESKSKNGILFLNPGECSGWLYGEATIGIINLKDLSVEKINLDLEGG